MPHHDYFYITLTKIASVIMAKSEKFIKGLLIFFFFFLFCLEKTFSIFNHLVNFPLHWDFNVEKKTRIQDCFESSKIEYKTFFY